MPSNAFASYIRDMANILAENVPQDKWEQREKYYSISTICDELLVGGNYIYSEDPDKKDEKPEFIAFTKTEIEQKIASLITFAKENKIPLTVSYKLFNSRNQSAIGDGYNFEIAGVYIPQSSRYGNEIIGVSDADFEKLWNEQKVSFDYYSETITSYVEPANAIYSVIFLPYQNNAQAIDSYWEIYSNKEFGDNSSRLALTGNFIYSIQNVDEMVKSLSMVFLYVGLVLAVFAILLFSNFISVSISQKTREIGILRAVGARSFDVFKIFFSESFVISVICVALATIASIITCHFINVSLASTLGASIFVFGPVSFIILVLIAFATAVISTFLPVYNAARKKPVDSIRSL
ncbi:MAG: FtsX-like permease family protein [Clostridiales bacterium]|nr:FtsX-like permease family protein [Clostridiales bacterium]